MIRHDVSTVASEGLVAAGVGIAAFLGYLPTVAPGVTYIDSGELATVCTLLGIAHPTGYPLFTLLGRIAAMMPVAAEEVGRLNLFSTAVVATATAVLYRLLLMVQNAVTVFPSRSPRSSAPGWMRRGVAIIIALSLAFTPTVWMQATSVEVYALHYLALTLILTLLIRGLKEMQEEKESASRWLVLAAYVTGLSFANHMTTLLLIPGVLLLGVWVLGRRRSVRIGVLAIPAFLVGLSIYAYLPIRSSTGPLLDWGHPATAERFLWHVSGKQYRSWIFSGFDSASRQLARFLENLPSEFTWIVLVLCVVGLLATLRTRPRLAAVSAVLWLTTVFYAVNYDIHDIESYFLLASVAMAMLAQEGLLVALSWAWRHTVRPLSVGLGLCALALPVVLFAVHRPDADQSGESLPEYYTRSVLQSLEEGAVVVTYQWDYFVSPSLYLQKVAGLRPDVTVIDKELLRRSWYFLQLERQAPDLIQQCRAVVDAFLEQLFKFEHDLPYDGGLIEARFQRLINALIEEAGRSRPVYVGSEIEPQFGSSSVRVPETLFFRLRKPGEPLELRPVVLEPPARWRGGRLEEGLRTVCSQMMLHRAILHIGRGERDAGREHLERALRWRPGWPVAVGLLEDLDRQPGSLVR